MSGGDAAQASELIVTAQDARTRSNLFNSQVTTPTEGVTGKSKINKKSPLELLLSPAIPLIHALTPCNNGRCLTNEDSTSMLGCAVVEGVLGNKFR